MSMRRRGLLLLNLGTPAAPRPREVRRYLAEFLSDPLVIDIHPIKRWLLLHLILLRFRPRRSAAAYREIWTDRGSPLLFHGEDLAADLQAELGDTRPVELGMRYQEPSVAAALARLCERGADEITVFPLFPQYSTAAWGSAAAHVYSEASKLWNVPVLQVVPPYYDHPAFVRAFAARVREVLETEAPPERIVFTFHGLPERHLHRSDPGQHCLREGCCDRIDPRNRLCYRAQCFATARALAVALELPSDRWEVAFQSRLGRDPWIRPYTDQRLTELATEGVRRVVVVSPSFTADCLETLEEIGIRGEADFRADGGESLRLVPSLNSEAAWVSAVIEIAGL